MTTHTSSRPDTAARAAARHSGLIGSLLFWLAVSLAVLAAIMLVETPRYALGDDNIQALFASGRYLNEFSLLMPYTLAPVSAPLALAYRALPQVPWYPLLLSALIVLAFGIAYRLAATMDAPRGMRAAFVIVLVAFEVACTMFFTFTVVAFLGVAAGLVLILPSACFGEAEGPRPRDLGGLLLISVGFSLRPESGLATLAVFSPFMVWALVKQRRAATLVRAAGVVGVIAVCYVAGHLAYQATPGWEGYTDYLSVGRNVLDFPAASVEDMQAAAPELSENDVLMMQDWNFVDTDVFSDEVFVQSQNAVSHYSLSNLPATLRAMRTWAVLGIGIVLAAVSVACARARRMPVHITVLAAAVGVLGILSYLLVIMRARLRFQVLLPIAVVTLMAIIVSCAAPARPRSAHAAAPAERGRGILGTVGLAFLALACAGSLAYFHHSTVRPIQNLIGSELSESANAYVRDNPDTLVVAAQTQTSLFGYDVFAFESWEYPENLLMVGGWENHTAPWNDFLEQWGLERGSTLMSLATRDDMVALLLPDSAELFLTYLQEHVDENVQMELVETVGLGLSAGTPNSIYRFYIAS